MVELEIDRASLILVSLATVTEATTVRIWSTRANRSDCAASGAESVTLA